VGLVQLGLLPLEVFAQGPGLAWRELLAKAQPCPFATERVDVLLGQLEAATMSDLDALREDCEAVAGALLEIVGAQRASADAPQRSAPSAATQARTRTCV
jgi:hypothetical protein